MYKHAPHIIATAKQYCEIPSVVGHEEPFFHYLEQWYKHKGYLTERYDGVLAIHGKRPHSHIVSAHIDRHGIIKTGEDEYQYAAFVTEQTKYHIDYYKSASFLESIRKAYDGKEVVAYDSSNGNILWIGTIHGCEPCHVRENLIFHISWFNADIPDRTPLSYSKDYSQDGDMFAAQNDNLISAAMIQHMFEEGYEWTALLTSEEEIGQSRYYMKNYIEKTYIGWGNLLIIDTCPMDEDEAFIREGKIVLRTKDAMAIFNKELTASVELKAKELWLPYLYADTLIDKRNEERESGTAKIGLGITELGQLIKHTKGKYGGTTIQIPSCGGYHTNHETVSLLGLENQYTLLHALTQ